MSTDEFGQMEAVGDGDRRLFKICRTLFEMLHDRGYSVEQSEIQMTIRQFIQKFGKNISRKDLLIHKAKENELEGNKLKEKEFSNQIYVFFPVPLLGKKSVGVDPLKTCIARMQSDKVLNAIFVVPNSLTSSGKKGLQLVKNHFNIDVFEDDELLVNITKHDVVPKHELLTDEQKKKVLKDHAVEEKQLPRILMNDPVAKYFGAKSGQIMKITRKSETAGKYTTYRFVV